MNQLVLTVALAQGTQAPSPILQFVPLVLIFGVFYFLLIAPMRKRQKALQEMIGALKKGDRVVTTGGIYGEVVALEDKTLLLRVSDDVRIKVSRSAVAGLEGQEDNA